MTRLKTLLAASAVALAIPAAANAEVLRVCSGVGQQCPDGAQYSTIQAAVDNASNGDWILVWPGKYANPTNVEPSESLNDDLRIRGMDRNGVLLDGAMMSAPYGIRVAGVNDVWLQNMTAHNFTNGSGNAFWWTDVDGYIGTHLTAYNTTNYGLYAYGSTSTDEAAVFSHSYASWNADSGIYIGECRDCNAVITDSISEYNPIGYSGTNAGGDLVIRNSEWANNATAILPNTLQSERDLPQRGVVIENNWVHDNNRNDVPRNGASDLAPEGFGILLAGGSDNIVRNNLIENQNHAGVSAEWLFAPATNNQIRSNTFRNVGRGGDQGELGAIGAVGDADITFGLGTAQNCVKNNVDITSGSPEPATMSPPNAAGVYECDSGNPVRDNAGVGVYGPGSPMATLGAVLNVAGISEPRNYQGPGPAPTAKDSMDNPCEGVPDNAWCSGGEPTVTPPSSPN